jgi:hypothetical protein
MVSKLYNFYSSVFLFKLTIPLQFSIFKVLNKTENTSAIYRLKVSEKYAFVQTNSKLIQNEFYDDQLFSETTENDKKIILSCHSIIK